MKSPAELKVVLRRQWEDPTRRESRLLGAKNSWPVVVSIGRPSPKILCSDLDVVKHHINAWRQVDIGEVVWDAIRYRATAEQIDVPTQWRLRKPSEWVDACNEKRVREEFETMTTLAERTDPAFHPLLIRKRSLWRGKPTAEVIQAAQLVMVLAPGCAAGKPLRMLSIEGIDTKFFERNAQLITALLDARFDGQVSQIGLEPFLGALAEGEHWLLVLDLDGSLLPFRKQRVRGSDLRNTKLPGERLLIVENECCQHHLPTVPQTVAVLGAGFDLSWAEGEWLATKKVAYWGDIDTWGLTFLATARKAIGQLDALLMTSEIFMQFADAAVSESVVAGTEPPDNLSLPEKSLYSQLLTEVRGRLEQEFLPEDLSRATILNWVNELNKPSTAALENRV